ncbi:DinB family protein [Shimazuella kribbensis]|uniref:DinB family protein n=1 Tax=Shimazuella kribbensis TaxID=139808 RepID=UPI00040E647E|nr:DinB family protein [Shimazuella kribbensis]
MYTHNEVRRNIWKNVKPLSDQQLNQSESTDRWSIAQILDHLLIIENFITKKIKDTLDVPTPPPINKPIHLTLNRSRKIKSPTTVSNDFQTLQSLQKKLNASRYSFESLIEQMTQEQLEQKSISHPVFGDRMSLKQWIEFVGLHEQRHLEQIKEVKANLRFP